MPNVISYLQALLTPIIGGVVAWIAFAQYRTAGAKLRLDLYERRFDIYDGLLGLTSHVVSKADVSLSELVAFRRATRQSCFLFGSDINAYLDEVYKKAVRFNYLCQKLRSLEGAASPERDPLIEEDRALLQWFSDQFDASTAKFAPYMALPQ